jgi:DNA-binding NarL/FixJ family response regulator
LDAADRVKPPVRILLVDDHPLTREGLAEVLQRESGLCVCGEAADRQEALETIPVAKPDLVIVDLALKESDGLELIKDMRAQFPKILVLVVSMQDELLYAERALRAGAAGFVSKEEAAVSVVQAVRHLLCGEVYISQRVASQMAARIAGHPRAKSLPALDSLTDRELQVFQLIGDGLSRQQIAQSLHLDVNTVETYRLRIREKLQLKNALELRQYAIRASRGCLS